MPYRSKKRCGGSDIIFFWYLVFFCGHFATDSKKVSDITKKQNNIFSHRMVFFLGRITTKKLAKTVKTTINCRGCKKKLGGRSKFAGRKMVILTVLQNFILNLFLSKKRFQIKFCKTVKITPLGRLHFDRPLFFCIHEY